MLSPTLFNRLCALLIVEGHIDYLTFLTTDTASSRVHPIYRVKSHYLIHVHFIPSFSFQFFYL